MKRHFFNFLAVTLLLITAFVACGDKTTYVTGVTLNESSLTLEVDQTANLIATVHPADADNKVVSWASNNNDVATVDNSGKVSAIAEGIATITVTTEAGNFKATCTITVNLPPPHPAEPELIWVEGGTFTMGCNVIDDEYPCQARELPLRQVTLDGFYIAKYPVTQKQWVAIMGSNPSFFQGDSDLPVERVSWLQAQEFISRLNEASGKNYRLPTEAEWEYAARGGYRNQGRTYSGSNSINEVAWHEGNSSNKTHPVGRKEPNELGICDMSGNVLEWCNDWFVAGYPNTAQTNPQGPLDGGARVQRGGSYASAAQLCRVSSRHNASPTTSTNVSGFRLVHP